MSQFAEIDLKSGGNYIELIKAISKLSGLFSDSPTPYINYRVIENIFCKSFEANNLSRSDTAFDANFQGQGIGIKTFTCLTSSSSEKIAEFNTLSQELRNYSGKKLAKKLGEYRNERINIAKRTYCLENDLYHIVARQPGLISIFETDYETIDLDRITDVIQKPTSLSFNDERNHYNFNFSKSTLFRKFIIPDNCYQFPIEIIQDPYEILLELFNKKSKAELTTGLLRGENFVILPLYGFYNKEKFVFEKSGLNQWNAGGRARDPNEIYIPIPKDIHREFPDFFPSKDQIFKLETPTGEIFDAKVCQDNSKALMTNPNKALSDWLLRKVLNLDEGKLATIEKLNSVGVDSVIIVRKNSQEYSIDIAKSNSFEKFISDPNFTIDDIK